MNKVFELNNEELVKFKNLIDLINGTYYGFPGDLENLKELIEKNGNEYVNILNKILFKIKNEE